MKKDLSKVIEVNEQRCVNCRKCISVCPVKFCNDCSKGYMQINYNLCIGCGSCIDVCSHSARIPIDDFNNFMNDIKQGVDIIAIVSPSAASNFPDKYLNLNGWLKSIGIKAIFDVSFGAELTIKSYIEHIKKNKPKAVISQPCPAIVTFIEIYKPELIEYLAPADSPMLHTIKMVKTFFSQYKDHKILVVSPCVAKRREFDATGFGNYNVIYRSIENYFKENNIDLRNFESIEFDNPPAERAVIFSTPGGLMKTAEREIPHISEKTRKIEGTEIIYPYLSKLPIMIKNNMNPLLIDCLSCEMGCNGGTGTLNRDKSPDEIEFYIEKRKNEMQKKYKSSTRKNPAKLKSVLNKYWKPTLYDRTYQDISENFNIKIPNDSELKNIYKSMHKYSDADIYNCSSCGYGTCEKMAIAVFNGLNIPTNCQFYNESVVKEEDARKNKLSVSIAEAILEIDSKATFISNIAEKIFNLNNIIELQIKSVNNVYESVNKILNSIDEVAKITEQEKQYSTHIIKVTKLGERKVKTTNDIISNISKNVDDILNTIRIINEIASKTDLLSMNASIEAAHAGNSGKGFMVVAEEIRNLAESSTSNSNNISSSMKKMIDKINAALKSSSETERTYSKITIDVKNVIKSLLKIIDGINELSKETKTTTTGINQLSDATEEVKKDLYKVKADYGKITEAIKNLKLITSQISEDINKISENDNGQVIKE